METACQKGGGWWLQFKKPVQTPTALTLLLAVEITLHRDGALHFTDLRGVFHSPHQLLHPLAGALIVVSRLQTKARRRVRI